MAKYKIRLYPFSSNIDYFKPDRHKIEFFQTLFADNYVSDYENGLPRTDDLFDTGRKQIICNGLNYIAQNIDSICRQFNLQSMSADDHFTFNDLVMRRSAFFKDSELDSTLPVIKPKHLIVDDKLIEDINTFRANLIKSSFPDRDIEDCRIISEKGFDYWHNEIDIPRQEANAAHEKAVKEAEVAEKVESEKKAIEATVTSEEVDVIEYEDVSFVEDIPDVPDKSIDIPDKCVTSDIVLIIDGETVVPDHVVEPTKYTYEYIEKTYGKMSNPRYDMVEKLRAGVQGSVMFKGYPTFDSSRVWNEGIGKTDGRYYCVYVATPEVPCLPVDVNITTDITKANDADCVHLFPTEVLKFRPEYMYRHIPNCYYHPLLGAILPIEGYTVEQLIDNIIKYPFVDELCRRNAKNQRYTLWNRVEVNGELVPAEKIWNTLPISELVPHSSKLGREYFSRKYLLDRDIKGVKYKYPIENDLQPYVILFMPPEAYESLGYNDLVGMGRQCLENRRKYIRSMNPIIKQIGVPAGK